MALLTQLNGRARVYIHLETTNQSFLDMHYYLKRTGRVNNDFFLVLYDDSLAGINPRDPLLPIHIKERVMFECRVNFWYFLREVIRIPQSGDDVNGGARYQLNRANLAMNYLFTLNYNFYAEIPRQWGKTVGIMSRLLWVYNFGTTNSTIALFHKEHSGSKDNLAIIKSLRDALPDYLQMSSNIGANGKKLKIPNTMITIQHPLNYNKIVTYASARSKDAADKMGRGATIPIQHYDEFAFMPFNYYAYLSAMPAFSKASENAKAHNSPYGVYITTTPGDLTTESGRFCYSVRNNATPWYEDYYDYSYEKLEQLRLSNINSSLFFIRYTYQQLGGGPEYFNRMCQDMNMEWGRIRREILLEWSEIADNCAFRKEDLEIIQRYCREPIRIMRFGNVGQYVFKVYEDLDPRFPPIIGVDVAGAMYQDSSAITIIDSKTTKVTATLNCNFIPSDDLADVLYVLVTTKLPNAVINIERNGGYGKTVVERLKKSSAKKNLYYEIKERVASESLSPTGAIIKNKQLVKVYGLDSTKEIRARLIEILYDRVNYHKDKFIDKTIYDEMAAMVVKPSGKVEHSNLTHDDQVFSYLMAMYVWYDGHDVMQNYGIKKNTIMTDENEEVIQNELDNQEDIENLDLYQATLDEESNRELKEQLDFIETATRKRRSRQQYEMGVYMMEQDQVKFMKSINPVFRKAYNEHYHIEDSDSFERVTLPDSVFEDYDDSNSEPFNGNLYDQFMSFRR